MVTIIQHPEVFFTLAHTQFRSSHGEVGVGANDMKWGTVREGKIQGIFDFLCFGTLAKFPTLFHGWNLFSYL